MLFINTVDTATCFG